MVIEAAAWHPMKPKPHVLLSLMAQQGWFVNSYRSCCLWSHGCCAWIVLIHKMGFNNMPASYRHAEQFKATVACKH